MSNETMKLSKIYTRLLDDIECIRDDGSGISISTEPKHSKCIQLIIDAVGEALQLMSSRCPVCDGTNFTIDCEDCKDEAVAAQLETELKQKFGRGWEGTIDTRSLTEGKTTFK